MAPGILPAAISPLINSSMRESFSTDNTAPGGGPSSLERAGGLVATTPAAAAANNATVRRNNAGSSGSMSGTDRLDNGRLLHCCNPIQMPLSAGTHRHQEY